MSTPPAQATPTGPRIRLSAGTGAGPTRLAAFDAALVAAGLAGFNLLPLSSVIPTGAQVEVVPPQEQVQGGHGDLLYCVYASTYAVAPGTQAWAGIAWGLRDDGSGAGLFVEHSDVTEDDLHVALGATLEAMMANRPHRYTEAGRLVTSARCSDQPVAAVVVASYRAVGWAQPVPSFESTGGTDR